MSIDNPYDEMIAAVRRGREVRRAIQSNANSLAELLDGNLRHVGACRLSSLKAQLRDFDSRTGKWKGRAK